MPALIIRSMVMNVNRLKQNLPYSILRLGMACNAACLFCNVPQESHGGRMRPQKELMHEIDALLRDDPGLRLDISGGEPTLHQNLNSIIRYAWQKRVKIIQLQTNAILLSDGFFLKQLKKSGLTSLFVSLHSHKEAHHDQMMGHRGAFKKTLRGIKHALKAGLEVVLNPVITCYNYQDLPDYMAFVKKELSGIEGMSLSVVQPRGRAFGDKKLVPSCRMIDPFVRRALSWAFKNGMRINNPYCGLPLCIGGWHYYLRFCVEYCENSLLLEGGCFSSRVNQDKAKAPQCMSCVLKNFCNGVWKEYAALYPLSDLKPLKKIPKQRVKDEAR